MHTALGEWWEHGCILGWMGWLKRAYRGVVLGAGWRTPLQSGELCATRLSAAPWPKSVLHLAAFQSMNT